MRVYGYNSFANSNSHHHMHDDGKIQPGRDLSLEWPDPIFAQGRYHFQNKRLILKLCARDITDTVYHKIANYKNKLKNAR